MPEDCNAVLNGIKKMSGGTPTAGSGDGPIKIKNYNNFITLKRDDKERRKIIDDYDDLFVAYFRFLDTKTKIEGTGDNKILTFEFDSQNLKNKNMTEQQLIKGLYDIYKANMHKPFYSENSRALHKALFILIFSFCITHTSDYDTNEKIEKIHFYDDSQENINYTNRIFEKFNSIDKITLLDIKAIHVKLIKKEDLALDKAYIFFDWDGTISEPNPPCQGTFLNYLDNDDDNMTYFKAQFEDLVTKSKCRLFVLSSINFRVNCGVNGDMTQIRSANNAGDYFESFISFDDILLEYPKVDDKARFKRDAALAAAARPPPPPPPPGPPAPPTPVNGDPLTNALEQLGVKDPDSNPQGVDSLRQLLIAYVKYLKTQNQQE